VQLDTHHINIINACKIPDEFGLAEDWDVTGLQLADGFAAALVMPSRCLVLNQYRFEL
jgi:hypothetical protein